MKRNLKKVLSLCLALVLVLSLLPVAASAAENENIFTYELNGKTETIHAADVNARMELTLITDGNRQLNVYNTTHPEWSNKDWTWVSSNPEVVYVCDAHDPNDALGGTVPGMLMAQKPGTAIIYAYAPGNSFPAKIAVTVKGAGAAQHNVWLSAEYSWMEVTYEKKVTSTDILTLDRYKTMNINAHDTAISESNYGSFGDGYWTITSSDTSVLEIRSLHADAFGFGYSFYGVKAGTSVVTFTDPEGRSASVNVQVNDAKRPGQGIFFCRYNQETGECPDWDRLGTYNSDAIADFRSIFTVGDEIYAAPFNWNERFYPEMKEMGWYTWHTSDPSIISIEPGEFMSADGRAVTKLVCRGTGMVTIWATDNYPNNPSEIKLIVVEPGHDHKANYNHTYHQVYAQPDWLGNVGWNEYVCTCGYYWPVDIPANATEEQYDHMYEETDRKEPTATADGYIKYTCSCGATKTEVLKATGGDECPSAIFVDAPKVGKWSHDAVDYVVKNGLMGGTDKTHFEPASNVDRAMLVTTLWRAAGSPEVEYKNTFPDVKAGKYYTTAVAWAVELQIVRGDGNGRFNPGDDVTRQDLCNVLYYYAKAMGIDTSARYNLGNFSDGKEISGYAKEAMSWLVAMDIIRGADGKVSPLDPATREQFALMLMNFIEKTK